MRHGLWIFSMAAALALAAVVSQVAVGDSPAVRHVQSVAQATPDLVYRQGTMALRLTQEPCAYREIEEILENEGIPPVKAYVMVQEGRPTVRGCWAPAAYDDEVLTQDMNGGDSFIPLSWFKPDMGV